MKKRWGEEERKCVLGISMIRERRAGLRGKDRGREGDRERGGTENSERWDARELERGEGIR